MRMRITFSLFIFITVVSCIRPLDTDFGFQQLGLGDDEFLWVLRLNRDPGDAREGNLTSEDSIALEDYNTPIFTQAMPMLIRELLSDSLDAYEDYEFLEEEKIVENLSDRLYKFGVNRQNFSSLLHSCDLLTTVKSRKGTVKLSNKFLRLVWSDPEGRLPDRNFVCVKIADLEKRNYKVTIHGSEVNFVSVLNSFKFHYLPVHLRHNNGEYSIQSPEEAAYLKKMVMAGNWDRIEFLDENINISGVTSVKVGTDILKEYKGVYEFDADNKRKFTQRLYLTVEQDHLVADWVQRTHPEKIYPYFDNAYFSPRGEFYLFPEKDDSLIQELFFVSSGDTIVGTRIQKFNP